MACPKTYNDTTRYDAKLPNPFVFANGRPVKTLPDFECRQREVSELFQSLELGIKPKKPHAVHGSVSGANLTVTVSVHGKTISSTPTITYPPNGTAPYPAVIAFGALTIPAPSGVAIITYNNDDIAAQNNKVAVVKESSSSSTPNWHPMVP